MKNLRSLELAVKMFSTFVVSNKIVANSLPELIISVHEALKARTAEATTSTQKPTPAIAIGKSVTPDYVVYVWRTAANSNQ